MENQDELDIPVVEGGGIDYAKYDGMKVAIASVKRIAKENHYKDNVYVQEVVSMIPAIEVETEPIFEYKDKDGITQKKTVKAVFNLQEKTDDKGVKTVVISKSPKANLWRFMRKLGCISVKEILGKKVMLTLVPSSDPASDQRYLNIVTN